MRVAIDSNVLLYAEGLDDLQRQATARSVLASIGHLEIVVPLQVLGEVFNVLARKFKRTAEEAADIVAAWRGLASYCPSTTTNVFEAGLHLATGRHLQVWDAMILAASAEAGSQILLSEDMSDGFVWRGLTVVNPFKPDPHPLLADLLRPH